MTIIPFLGTVRLLPFLNLHHWILTWHWTKVTIYISMNNKWVNVCYIRLYHSTARAWRKLHYMRNELILSWIAISKQIHRESCMRLFTRNTIDPIRTLSSFWKYSLKKDMGFSGRPTHNCTIQSFKTCWILCLCTYSSHSLKLCSSSRFAAILIHKLSLYNKYPLNDSVPGTNIENTFLRWWLDIFTWIVSEYPARHLLFIVHRTMRSKKPCLLETIIQ